MRNFKIKLVLKRVLFTCIATVFLWSCHDIKKREKPEDLIPKDEMITLLTDIYIINAAKSVNRKNLIIDGFILNEYVQDKYGIDSLQLKTSNAYYASNLDEYEAMFLKVKSNLTAALGAQKITDSLADVKKDSINKASRKTLREKIKKEKLKKPPSLKRID